LRRLAVTVRQRSAVGPRLAQDAEGRWTGCRWLGAEGELRAESGGASHVWLHLRPRWLAADLPALPDLADIPLQVDRSFRFVADEATAELEDEAEMCWR
jgi:uncharacterized protein